MTDGEKMVWAAEFSRQMATTAIHSRDAARQATSLVHAMRKLRNLDLGDYEAEAMVARMTEE